MVPGSSPPFALPTPWPPDPRGTVDRLAQIMRKAMNNPHPQFATIYYQRKTIYEQRKTNTLLVEGFSTLGTAIYAVGDSITSSIADLSASLHADAEDVLENLDNIQRGRKP